MPYCTQLIHAIQLDPTLHDSESLQQVLRDMRSCLAWLTWESGDQKSARRYLDQMLSELKQATPGDMEEMIEWLPDLAQRLASAEERKFLIDLYLADVRELQARLPTLEQSAGSTSGKQSTVHYDIARRLRWLARLAQHTAQPAAAHQFIADAREHVLSMKAGQAKSRMLQMVLEDENYILGQSNETTVPGYREKVEQLKKAREAFQRRQAEKKRN